MASRAASPGTCCRATMSAHASRIVEVMAAMPALLSLKPCRRGCRDHKNTRNNDRLVVLFPVPSKGYATLCVTHAACTSVYRMVRPHCQLHGMQRIPSFRGKAAACTAAVIWHKKHGINHTTVYIEACSAKPNKGHSLNIEPYSYLVIKTLKAPGGHHIDALPAGWAYGRWYRAG